MRHVTQLAGAKSKRQAQDAADSFMMVMAGNQPHYEEAARALYAGNVQRFTDLTEGWPQMCATMCAN